jgi:hypothetical protein
LFYSFTELVLSKYSRTPEILKTVQNDTIGCYIKLHNCVRIIPSPEQGIEPFEIYASNNDNSRSGIPGNTRARFDWVELLDSSSQNSFSGLYSQVAAIVETKTKSHHEFFFIGNAK